MAFNTTPEIYLNLGLLFSFFSVSQLETSSILGSAQAEPTKRRADTDTLSVCPAHKGPLSSASLRGPGQYHSGLRQGEPLAQLEQSGLSSTFRKGLRAGQGPAGPLRWLHRAENTS